MAKKTWSDLSQGSRGLIVVAGVAEAGLKAAMLFDLRRRPADQIRGSKWMWAPLAFVNLVGPLSYFAVGRRRQGECHFLGRWPRW
jgi:Phospholipase_D-nuclease N-terminal